MQHAKRLWLKIVWSHAALWPARWPRAIRLTFNTLIYNWD